MGLAFLSFSNRRRSLYRFSYLSMLASWLWAYQPGVANEASAELPNLSEFHSLMFNAHEISQINDAIEAEATGKPLQTIALPSHDTATMLPNRVNLLDVLKAAGPLTPNTPDAGAALLPDRRDFLLSKLDKDASPNPDAKPAEMPLLPDHRDFFKDLLLDPTATPVKPKSFAPQWHIDDPARVAPVFQLQSLLYLGKDAWMVVVNGQTITSDTLPKDKKVAIDWPNRDPHLEDTLTLIEVTPDDVVFSWDSNAIPFLSPNITSHIYYSAKGLTNRDSTILMNHDLNQVIFLLRMNQVFSLYEMVIHEYGID